MALSRVNPGGALIYTNASFSSGATLALPVPAPPGTLLTGEEQILVVEQYSIGSGMSASVSAGWIQIGGTPQDLAVGADGTTIRLVRIYKRPVDGTSRDTPSITLQNTAGSSRQILVHAVRYKYVGGKLKAISSGSVGNAAIAPPTLPASVTSPPRGLIISTAYQTRTFTAPDLTAANGFDRFYVQAPPSTFQPIGLGIADNYLVDDVVALPQWNVSRGNTVGAHHHAWALLQVEDETKPFIRLSGLTFGTKRRRLGQPGATP
jgi:hypothetical protein